MNARATPMLMIADSRAARPMRSNWYIPNT